MVDSVLQMLTRPVAKPESREPEDGDLMEYIRFKVAQGEAAIREDMQKQIDAAVAVQEGLRQELESMRRLSESLDQTVGDLRVAINNEREENGKLRDTIERDRTRFANDSEKAGAMLDLLTSYGMKVSLVNDGLDGLRAGIERVANRPVQVTVPERKQAAAKAATVIPDFDFKITSRDMNGDILTLTAVPRK